MILAFWVFSLACLCAGESIAAKGDHPPVVLLDHQGREISLHSDIPYSPKKTCGECHDYDAITNAYHFQQGRTDIEGNTVVRDDLDSQNPWLISRGMYGKW